MSFWRMQLHPSESENAVEYCVNSLATGYIGLDFKEETRDLGVLKKEDIPAGQRDFWDFANLMNKGDWVLIVAHHFPFALARVAKENGDYNFIRHSSKKEIGVWFRYFRKVDRVFYYADYQTDVRKWDQIRMTDTISPLKDETSKSYRLISKWLDDCDHL